MVTVKGFFKSFECFGPNKATKQGYTKQDYKTKLQNKATKQGYKTRLYKTRLYKTRLQNKAIQNKLFSTESCCEMVNGKRGQTWTLASSIRSAIRWLSTASESGFPVIT